MPFLFYRLPEPASGSHFRLQKPLHVLLQSFFPAELINCGLKDLLPDCPTAFQTHQADRIFLSLLPGISSPRSATPRPTGVSRLLYAFSCAIVPLHPRTAADSADQSSLSYICR